MRHKAISCFALLSIYVLMILVEAKACPVPLSNNASQRGELTARIAKGVGIEALEHQLTHVRVIDYASFHQVFVTEIFKSNFPETIHGHYSIQLPQDASIKNIDIRIGERRMEIMYNEFPLETDYLGIIYNHIEDSDEIARLLDKDCPSTFAQPIPNIQPGEEVEISIRYFERVYASDQISYAEGGEEDICLMGVYRKINPYILLISCTMFFMFLYLLGAIIRRFIVYYWAGSQSRYFVSRINKVLRLNQWQEAISISQSYTHSPVAKIMTEVFITIECNPHDDKALPELCGSARSRAIAKSDAELKRGLRRLQTTGWLAMMLGFLGTVIGLLEVFQGAMDAEATGLSAIAGGVSESFVIALFGLIIALPSIWAHKYFSSKVRKIGIEADKASWEILDSLLKKRRQENVINQMQSTIYSDCYS